jgi:hypothetical protein
VDTRAFLLSGSSSLGQVVKLGQLPREMVLVSGQAFFRVPADGGDILLWYETLNGQQRPIVISGTPLDWNRARCESVWIARESAHTVRFDLRSLMPSVPSGVYDLDARDGLIRPHSGAARGRYEKTADERYAWFYGRNAPLFGRDLVTTVKPWPSALSGQAELRIVHRFPRGLALFRAREYYLQGLSPCRQFALVRQSQSVVTRKGHPSETRNYFLVNLETGVSRLMIQDQVARKTGARVSVLQWVGFEPTPPETEKDNSDQTGMSP